MQIEFLLVGLSSLLHVKRTVGLTKNIQFWLDPRLSGLSDRKWLELFSQVV